MEGNTRTKRKSGIVCERKRKTEETDSQKNGLQSKSTSRGKNRKILEFSQLQTPRRREKVGRCISEVGRREKKILGAQKTQRKQKSKNWGMLLNEQTWETGLSSRQDEEGKGIHESSDEFHE